MDSSTSRPSPPATPVERSVDDLDRISRDRIAIERLIEESRLP